MLHSLRTDIPIYLYQPTSLLGAPSVNALAFVELKLARSVVAVVSGSVTKTTVWLSGTCFSCFYQNILDSNFRVSKLHES